MLTFFLPILFCSSLNENIVFSFFTISSVLTLFGILIADILYSVVDPRITFTKNYHYIDDYISPNSTLRRQPRLIFTDLRTRIIENENCNILKKRLNDIDNNFPDFRFKDYSTPLLLACNYYLNIDFFFCFRNW